MLAEEIYATSKRNRGTFSVGAYKLCAQIPAADSESNSTEAGNINCDLIFGLRDMGDEFPEPVLPVDFESAPEPGWSITNCVPKDFWLLLDLHVVPHLSAMVSPSAGVSLTLGKPDQLGEAGSTARSTEQVEEQSHWIFASTGYRHTTAMKEVHEEFFPPTDIVPLKDSGTRVEVYQGLALSGAIKEARRDQIYKLTPGDPAGASFAKDGIVEMGRLSAEFGVIADGAELLTAHRESPLATGSLSALKIGEPVVDAIFSAVGSRTIDKERAIGNLVMPKQLPMDDAWEAGVDCPWVELRRMAGGSLMDQWYSRIQTEPRQGRCDWS